MNCQLPFHILKKVLVIQDSDIPYSLDEDGYCSCHIDDYEVQFQINEYCEILVESITCSKD